MDHVASHAANQIQLGYRLSDDLSDCGSSQDIDVWYNMKPDRVRNCVDMITFQFFRSGSELNLPTLD